MRSQTGATLSQCFKHLSALPIISKTSDCTQASLAGPSGYVCSLELKLNSYCRKKATVIEDLQVIVLLLYKCLNYVLVVVACSSISYNVVSCPIRLKRRFMQPSFIRTLPSLLFYIYLKSAPNMALHFFLHLGDALADTPFSCFFSSLFMYGRFTLAAQSQVISRSAHTFRT